MKLASTIPGKWTGKIKRIMENIGKNKVKVAFEMPNGDEYIDGIPKSFLKR